MNKWQEVYVNTYYDGKKPRTKIGKEQFELLGLMKSKVIVHFPDFNGANGFIPAHTEEYIITEDDCDMPNGKISVSVLSGNLTLWKSRGYKIETF